jgi:tetratricopeptide (TPR) repeat protein
MLRLPILDELGIRRVTDKCSLFHDYLTKYERLFAPFRDAPITFLEIGVFDGGSLRLWEDYFPRATIVGLDIRAECKQHEGGRRIVEIASQADAGAMAAVGQKYQPDIIIDDGSHQADHILITFQALYPSLREGGLYLIEDLGMHAGQDAAKHRGSAPMSPQKYFLTLANRVTCPGEDVEFDHNTAWTTESVEFFESFAAIKKRPLPDPDRIESRRRVVEQTDLHTTWGWFSKYLLLNGGSADEAIECATRAVRMSPHDWPSHLALSQALERAGRTDEAIVAVHDAARCAPDNRLFSEWMANLVTGIEARRDQS